MDNVTIKQIHEASSRIEAVIHRTPVLTSRAINSLCQAELFFKCENLQKSGSFKMRGASNAVFSLAQEKAKNGVATHSSGNHAGALALAAKTRGIPCYVVMPSNAPAIKRAAVEEYGAEILPCEPSMQAREAGIQEVLNQTGAEFVPPYNDFSIIAGQGTAALELFDVVSNLDMLLTPLGGGGLLSGSTITSAGISPETEVIGVEPEMADDAKRSIESGHIIPSDYPDTVADGLRTSLGDLTFDIIQKQAAQIATVSEEGIIQAMRLIWERMKIVIEPSAAVTLAALLENPKKYSGKRTGLILSGGNVDLNRLPWI